MISELSVYLCYIYILSVPLASFNRKQLTLFPSSSKENQCSLDMKSKLNTNKQAENGQPESQNKVPTEDLTLTFR
jgi:hypothetical protein